MFVRYGRYRRVVWQILFIFVNFRYGINSILIRFVLLYSKECLCFLFFWRELLAMGMGWYFPLVMLSGTGNIPSINRCWNSFTNFRNRYIETSSEIDGLILRFQTGSLRYEFLRNHALLWALWRTSKRLQLPCFPMGLQTLWRKSCKVILVFEFTCSEGVLEDDISRYEFKVLFQYGDLFLFSK